MCVFVHYFQLSLSEGCRLPVRMNGTEDWPLAEIISIRDVQGSLMFYVHYVDCKFAVDVFPFRQLAATARPRTRSQ